MCVCERERVVHRTALAYVMLAPFALAAEMVRERARVCVRVSVCMCVRERERERVCVRERESESC